MQLEWVSYRYGHRLSYVRQKVDPSWRLVATSKGKTERGAITNLEPSADREELYKDAYIIEKTVLRFILNELHLFPAAAIRD